MPFGHLNIQLKHLNMQFGRLMSRCPRNKKTPIPKAEKAEKGVDPRLGGRLAIAWGQPGAFIPNGPEHSGALTSVYCGACNTGVSASLCDMRRTILWATLDHPFPTSPHPSWIVTPPR